MSMTILGRTGKHCTITSDRHVQSYVIFHVSFRTNSVQHGMQCFSRLVHVLLGPTALASDKQACGSTLEILGLDVALGCKGFRCRPSRDKRDKWLKELAVVKATKKLKPGLYA